MNEMMGMAMKMDAKELPIKHIPGPEGVRGRNSDNKLILDKLGWEPTISLQDGLKWVPAQLPRARRLRLRSHNNDPGRGRGRAWRA